MNEPTLRRPFRWKLALISAAVLLVLASPFWAPVLLRQLSFFRVRHVEIIGARYVPPGEILARLQVDTSASVWDSSEPLVERLSGHPEIERVEIGRRLPGTLVVKVTEHVPVALVPAPRGFLVYDARGVALPIDPARTPVDAPVVARRNEELLKLLGALRIDDRKLFDRLSEVQLVGGDELLLQLANFHVRTMTDVTVARLADIEPVESDLARRQLEVAELDLRFRDQVIARLK